jgi:hypothetical protein
MSDEKQNRISSAADFKAALESQGDLYGQPEVVALPELSKRIGKPFEVTLRRPTLMLRMLKFGTLPQAEKPAAPKKPEDATFADEVILAEPLESEKRSDAAQAGQALDDIFLGMFVKPKVSRNPQGADEVSIAYLTILPQEDLYFLIGWAMGSVGSDGAGLDTFRSRTFAALGAGGGDLGLQAERPAQTPDQPLAN